MGKALHAKITHLTLLWRGVTGKLKFHPFLSVMDIIRNTCQKILAEYNFLTIWRPKQHAGS